MVPAVAAATVLHGSGPGAVVAGVPAVPVVTSVGETLLAGTGLATARTFPFNGRGLPLPMGKNVGGTGPRIARRQI